MSTAEIAIPVPRARPRAFGPLATLARRRFQLTARTPRELVVPLLTPIMFALVIAPALKTALHTAASYESFVAIGTIGLLIPLNTMFAGLGVIVDRDRVVPRRRRPLHRRHVRRCGDPRQPRAEAGGVHRARPGDRDPPVVPG